MPDASISKQSLEKSAALKIKLESYYHNLVQQTKERESRYDHHHHCESRVNKFPPQTIEI